MKSVRKKVNVINGAEDLHKNGKPALVSSALQSSSQNADLKSFWDISRNIYRTYYFVKPKLGIKAIIRPSCSQIVGLFLYKELLNEFRGC